LDVILPRLNRDPNNLSCPPIPKIREKKGANKVRDIKEKIDANRFKTKYKDTSFG
jgi:hypothetical protein